MTKLQLFRAPVLTVTAFSALFACGSDHHEGTEAQRRGVGSSCASDEECTEAGQRCLTFKGGYCGVADCLTDANCPQGSACVAHSDGRNYCFLICANKPECNVNRPLDIEANCASNITFTTDDKTRKACVPPSG
jgi:hypothetical protein